MSQFNCHNHTEGSFLDGQARVEESAAAAKAAGHEIFTVTDHGECNQHLRAAKAAAKHDLLFVPGIEGYWMYPEAFAASKLPDPETGKKKQPSPSHICMLAMNDTGLRNLWAISSIAYSEQYFYYKPIASPELLSTYSEGIWASDGCLLTEFADKVECDDEDGARAILGTLLGIFKERFYMELHTWQYMNPRGDDAINWGGKTITSAQANAKMTKVNQAKVRFAQELGVPLVVVNDSHHAFPEQWLNKELVWAFNTGSDNDKLQATLEEATQKADHIMGEDELYHWMGKHGVSRDIVAQAIANSYEIGRQCQVQIKPTLEVPRIAPTEREDLAQLIDACEVGFKRLVTDQGLDEPRYYARLEEELRLIADKHFAGYFNMVRDYTSAYRSGVWSQYVKPGATKEPMLLGPGRGSVGGSLVGYLTGIDTIDPIEYGTLFSRFLTPARKGLPDVDLDVPRSQRPDALKYFPARFGADKVCLIGTLSHNGPKQTVKDLGRALGITKLPNGYTDLQTISDHIEEVERMKDPNNPDDEELTWEELIERKGGALAPYRQRYPALFEKVEEMVGLIRHSGVHAAGVLVSSTPLMGAMPMRRTKNGVITTQLDMWEVEELGGVKIDILGIRHLDTLSIARRLIYEQHGVWVDYDRSGLSVPKGCDNVITFGKEHFRDPAIWPQIGAGRTLGIFQIETSNGTDAAISFKPASEVDVADLSSIVRPGVADAGLKEVYLRRRAGVDPVVYDHPLMERIVGPGWATNTFGVLVYQEQLIEAVQLLANFTPDEGDDLRKAVGKKQMDKVMALRDKYIKGCLTNEAYMRYCSGEKQATQIAYKIWNSIEASGRYAFNWSHAVGYAMISSWEVWTKYHYPREFLIALMQTDAEKINRYIREARRLDIPILPPDINKSAQKFTIEDKKAIRYGLDTVRDVGAVASRHIIKGRPYTGLDDYLKRAGKGANLRAVTNLIKIGAFDEVYCGHTSHARFKMGGRVDLLEDLERYRAMEDLAESTKANPTKLEQIVANRMASGKYSIEIPDFTDPKVMYGIEKELVGTYVSVDPMARYVPTLEAKAIREPEDIYGFKRGELFIIGGQVASIGVTTTKKGRRPGQEMAHVVLTWNDADFRVVIWPDQWRAVKAMLSPGVPVAFQVRKLDSGCCLEHMERLDILFDREGIA